MPTREDAVAALRDQAALTQAEAAAVVDAVAAVAADEVLEQIAGEEPTTGTAAELRAIRVARICNRVGRLLSAREVEVLLRVPPATARSTLGRVRAGWPSHSDAWIAELVKAQLDKVEDASTDEEGERWRIIFNDNAALGYAAERLRREGMSRDLLISAGKQELLVPKQMRDRRGQLRDPRKVLGL
jgi:hypothetical protein